jgi:hypothetical protein
MCNFSTYPKHLLSLLRWLYASIGWFASQFTAPMVIVVVQRDYEKECRYPHAPQMKMLPALGLRYWPADQRGAMQYRKFEFSRRASR